MAVSLTLPTIQNWSCHNCGGCCRQHAIEVTEDERQRILAQGWSAEQGTPAGDALFKRHAGPPWAKRYRLAHQADGACVFLNEQGLCRIHAKFGEAAKPLACRIYPYAFHPAGSKVAVSLRFSCPSVVANLGKTMSQNADQIKQLARAVVPDGHEKMLPPALSSSERLSWPDLLRVVDVIDESLSPTVVPISLKLQRTLFWLNLVEQSKFDKLSGARLSEFLGIVRQAAEGEVTHTATGEPPVATVSNVGQVHFRLLCAQYARKDTAADRAAGWRGRWKLFRAATRFARGVGGIGTLRRQALR